MFREVQDNKGGLVHLRTGYMIHSFSLDFMGDSLIANGPAI